MKIKKSENNLILFTSVMLLSISMIMYGIFIMISCSFIQFKTSEKVTSDIVLVNCEKTNSYNIKNIEIPPIYINYNMSCKTYMDYKKITNKSSKQYQYINNSGEIFVNDKGYLQTDDEFIGVAMGSYFGDIGNKFIVELDTNKYIKVVKVESKADADTCELNFMGSTNNDVIEFVVDTSSQYMQENINKGNGLVFQGNFNNHHEFNGNIKSIKQVM